MDNNKLIGKNVTMYLDGGWEVSGLVKTVSGDRIVIDSDGSLYLVFKPKVSALLVGQAPSETQIKDNFSAASSVGSDDSFPVNKIEYEESGMSIPRDLLSLGEDSGSESTFSSFFGAKNTTEEQAGGKGSTGIRFTTEDDSEK